MHRNVAAELAATGVPPPGSLWLFAPLQLDLSCGPFQHGDVTLIRTCSRVAASLIAQNAIIKHGVLTLRPGEAVPQHIAEVALAHEDLLSAWSTEEADPDSVLDAIDAMLLRLIQIGQAPALTLETEEGDR